MRIAMWSGPRNLSTALMYSFGARRDMAVMDEPFYAAYLAATGLDHPMRDAVLASQPTDPEQVKAALLSKPGRAHVYQKHMAHHILPGFLDGWTAQMRHVFLIRHPARVIASYLAKRDRPALADLGIAQQAALATELGTRPLVVEAEAIRADPRRALEGLCRALDLEFDPAMLHWPTGPRPEDGAWAPHWYAAVHRSTGFAAPEEPVPSLDAAQAPLLERAMEPYLWLKKFVENESRS